MSELTNKLTELGGKAVKGVVGATEKILETASDSKKQKYGSLVPEEIEMPERATIQRREFELSNIVSNMQDVSENSVSEIDAQIQKIENVAFKHHMYRVHDNYYPEFVFAHNVDAKSGEPLKTGTIKTTSYEQKIRGLIVKRFVFDPKELQIDKMNNIFASMADMGSTLAMVIHRTSKECTLAFLMKSNSEKGTESESIADNTIETFSSSIKGNFPGTELQPIINYVPQPEIYAAIPEINDIPTDTIRDCRGFVSYFKKYGETKEKGALYSVADFVDEIFNPEQAKAVAVVTGIPSVKSKDSKYLNQGIEKLLDGAKPTKDSENYTIILLAEPLLPDNIGSIRNGYEQMASMLTPFHSFQYNITDSFGYSKNLNETQNITNQVGSSTNYSVGVGAHAGANASANGSAGLNRGKQEGSSDAHMDGTHKDESNTVGGSFGNSTTVGAGASAGVPGVATASTHVDNTTSVTVDQHHTSGSGTSKSDTHTISNMFNKGYNLGGTAGAGASIGINANVGMSETVNTGRSYTGGFTFGESTTENRSLAETRTFTSISVENILERLKGEIKRFNDSESAGMWRFAGYVLSGELAMAERVAHMYQGLIQGEESAVERNSVNTWIMGDSSKKGDYNAIITSLLNLEHPIFKLRSESPLLPKNIYCSTEITGTELALAMNMPQRSVVGLPVVSCASFGRNISKGRHSFQDKNDSIDIGCHYHMLEMDQNNPFPLSISDLTAHTFVTGSTGSGKSNTIYTLLNRLNEKNTKFLVIEPAKGEYKDVFGMRKDVSIYGTNPALMPLLRINPFSFPTKNIHILEHLDRLVEIFNVCWPMYAAMPAILKDAIERAYIEAGWDLVESKNDTSEQLFPSFIDVLKQIEIVVSESAYSADSKGDYTGALMTRVKSLTNGLNRFIFTNNEIPAGKLFDQNAIVDLSRVGSTETKALIMGILVLKLQEYRMSEKPGNNSNLKHITVLEEAHHLLKRTSTEQATETANLLGKSVEMLSNAIAEMRTYGEGFIIADQSPGLLDMSVIRNTNTKIIMRLPDFSDRELVGKAASLNDEQIIELSKLEQGVAAVTQSGWLEPVLCKVDYYEVDNSYKYNNPETISADHINQDFAKALIAHNARCFFEKKDKEIIKANIPVSLKKLVIDCRKKQEFSANHIAQLAYEMYEGYKLNIMGTPNESTEKKKTAILKNIIESLSDLGSTTEKTSAARFILDLIICHFTELSCEFEMDVQSKPLM